MSVVIVDYDVGNLHSVKKGFEQVGATAIVSRDRQAIANADSLVLPGVGAFGTCMDNLKSFGLVKAVQEFLSSGKPFLGICVGYQLLFELSEEFGEVDGLGVLKGKCVRFSFETGKGLKIPHMGWNQVRYKKPSKLFDGISDGSDFYFVHSYYPVPEDENIIAGQTEYGGETFCAAIEKGNIFATQFHPEKSQQTGLKVLSNFASLDDS